MADLFLDESSNGRVVRATASGAVDSGLISSRVKLSRQVYLCRWERHLEGFPSLRLVGRWSATPKRARYNALIAFS